MRFAPWLLALAAAAAGAEEVYVQVDIPDTLADACSYVNTTLGQSFTVPVEVNQTRGKPEYGYRICKTDTAGWPTSGNVNVSFTAKRTATGEESVPLAGALPRAVPGSITLVAAAPTPPTVQESLWSNATPPGVIDGGADNPVTLGVRFTTAKAGKIIGLRFYKYAGNTGAHVGNLWSNAGVKLATLTFGGETASGWQSATFVAPVPVAAGTYVASYHTTTGFYAFTSGYFASPYTAGNLTALMGLFSYGAAPAFPAGTWQNGNYWVDVMFEAD